MIDTQPDRDQLIMVAMDALSVVMMADPSALFQNAAAVVDALLERFDIITCCSTCKGTGEVPGLHARLPGGAVSYDDPSIDHKKDAALPDTWHVVECNNPTCMESWTTDMADFSPALNATETEEQLMPFLRAHFCGSVQ